MSGIFTSSRKFDGFPKAEIIIGNTGTNPIYNKVLYGLLPTQTTTSFRTRGVDSVTGDDAALATLRDINSRSWLGYSPYDTGHPFDTIKEEMSTSHPLVDFQGTKARYRGPLIVRNGSGLPLPGFPQLPSFDSNYYGTAAINRTVPNKPVSDMANALGELRTVGGVPKVMGTILNFESRTKFARSAGKEYLNSVFGWTPLVKDIESIANAVIKSDRIVQQYLADSGKGIRRKYTFEPIYENIGIGDNIVLSNTFFGLDSNHSQLYDAGASNSGRGAYTVNHDRKIWFSGQYTYYLPDGVDPASQMRKYASLARKLVGGRLSPEVLWELQPWSWLVDWFFNIGQILENIEAFQTDGLVMRYGYLMVTDKVTKEIVAYRHGFSNRVGPVTCRYTVTRKQRIRATPYGFGLDPSTWSPERWAILGALGLTKTPTSLR